MVPFLELGVGFNPELSGRENVFLNGVILGMKKSVLKEKYQEIVEFAELEKFMDAPLKNYSSGMQVRLAFSIAIMADADVYILDEVLAVGDVAFQEKCFNVFRKYKEDGKTVILVTHSPQSVKDFCDRAVLLKDGVLHKFENVDQVIEAYING
jgi:ABC-2 type transport system ATP-binding protein